MPTREDIPVALMNRSDVAGRLRRFGCPVPEAPNQEWAATLGRLVTSRRLSIATAESMTGGAVAEELVAVPGSGEWLLGGVVAYSSRLKFGLLGVREGPVVTEAAAREMATGVVRLTSSDVGIATTGCAGPEPMEGQPVGTLWVGVAMRDHVDAVRHELGGDPSQIRAAAVRAALRDAARFVASIGEVPS